MSKTPYEIRLELLNLAKEILQAPIYQKRESLSDEYHSKLTESNRGTLPYPTMQISHLAQTLWPKPKNSRSL
jgi:hypothetical protein